MKRRIFWGSGLVFLVGSMCQAFAAENFVKVLNWSDYIDEQIMTDFETETGIKVVYDVFDSNDVLEKKLLAGGSGYDIVVPSADFMSHQIQAGVFQKLDQSLLDNKGNIWNIIAKRMAAYDPENAYSVNYMWGTTGLGYNAEMVKSRLGVTKIESWDFIFNPEKLSKLQDCGIHVLDAADEMIPLALHYLGKKKKSLDPEDIQAAEALLLSIRPYIQKFHSSDFISGLANGKICLAIGWSGDVFQARDRADEAGKGVRISFAIPKEGTQMWFDQMAIPADAQNVGNAHKFINYILRADVAAKLTNYTYYANGNKASQPLINTDILEDPAIYPPASVMIKLFTLSRYPAHTQLLISQSWERIKNSQ